MTKTSSREGAGITEPTDIPTASSNESQSGHTPGPWRVEYVIDGAFEIRGTAEGDQFVIASRNECRGRLFESDANAHLIASAPELLAALKALVDAYEDPQMDDPHALVLTAKDAIDRAGGHS